MQKKFLILSSLLALSFASAAWAAPLTNYSTGKVSFQVGVNTLNDMKSVLKNATFNDLKDSTFDGHEKSKPYMGVTVGLCKGLAGQYRYEELKSNPSVDTTSSSFNLPNKIRSQEYNLRYLYGKMLSFYVGDYHVKFSGGSNGEYAFRDKTKDILHIGATCVVPLIGNLCAWGDVGVGKDLYHYEVGVGYNIAKNICLDVSYKYLRFDKMGEFCNTSIANVKIDGKTRGLRVGLTFNF